MISKRYQYDVSVLDKYAILSLVKESSAVTDVLLIPITYLGISYRAGSLIRSSAMRQCNPSGMHCGVVVLSDELTAG